MPEKSTGQDRDTELLEQLTTLAGSVKAIAERTAPAAAARAIDGAGDGPRLTALFAYTFLGEVTGRRGAPAFATPRVQVTRDGKGLTFTGLRGGTVARVRAADGSTETLTGLTEGRAARSSLPGDQRLDSIVVLTGDGVPVALGPCLDPLPVIG